MKPGFVHAVFAATLLIAIATLPAGVAPARAAEPPDMTGQPVKPRAVKKPKAPRPPRNLNDAWDRGSNWISVRAGYAKAGYDGAAGGRFGAGFGYTHMVFHAWSLGGYVQYDLLGRFGAANESELPFTIEVARHLTWGSFCHPYLGLGGGTFFHKTYRTGDDVSDRRGGGYFLTGFNTPISAHALFGFDLRAGLVGGDPGHTNPVFGVEKARSSRWSAKLNWSYTY